MDKKLPQIYLSFDDYDDCQEIKEQLFYLYGFENRYEINWCNDYEIVVNVLGLNKYNQDKPRE